MMHQGMDLSRFKKVDGDKKMSTLRHANGHEIKIVHSGLTPKMREVIAGMPLHQFDPQGPVTAMDPQSPATSNDAPDDAAAAPTDAPAAVADAPTPANPAPADAPVAPAPAATTDAPAAAPHDPTDPNVIDVVGHQAALDKDSAEVGMDMQRGQIHPQTMAGLWAKKDTLGKLGTLFGLMIGGAGAGLSHQQNALLELMKKQIDQDMEAQVHSNANAQNWYRMSQAHELQKAQLKQMGVQNEQTQAVTGKTKAETGKIPSEIERNIAEVERTKADTGKTKAEVAKIPGEIQRNAAETGRASAEIPVLAAAAAKGNMANHFLKVATDQVDTMAPGVAKDNANAALNTTLAPGVQGFIKDTNAKAAQQVGVIRTLNGAKPPGAVDTGVNDAELKKQMQIGAAGQSAAGVYLGIPPSQHAQALDEANLVKGNRAALGEWDRGWRKLDNEFLAGAVNPADRETIVNTVADQMAKTRGNMSLEKIHQIADESFPSAKDWGPTREDKRDFAYNHFKTAESKTAALDLVPGVKSPMPPPPPLAERRNSSAGTIVGDVIRKAGGAADAEPAAQYKVVGGVKYKKGPKGEAIPVK